MRLNSSKTKIDHYASAVKSKADDPDVMPSAQSQRRSVAILLCGRRPALLLRVSSNITHARPVLASAAIIQRRAKANDASTSNALHFVRTPAVAHPATT